MTSRSLSSGVWEYFARDSPTKGKATCKLCPHPGRILSFNGSTTSNLWSHIKSQHDRVFAASSSKRDGEAKKSSIGSTSSLQRQASGASSSQILSFVQKSVCPEGRARQITHLIANWCARDVRPMGIVDDQGLRDIFAYVEPGYRLPSRTHVTSLLKRQYELALGKLRGLLNGGAADDTTCLAFTTDIWTSAAVEAYLTLTGHFLTADFSLMSCCLGTGAFPERHTGENIADKVRTMLRAFRVPEKRQVALVHDQASNMQCAGKNLESENRALFSVVCAPHRLQNTIKAGLQVPRVSKLLASARKLVTHFRHSVVAMEAIRKSQAEKKDKQLKFVQNVSTRWNSSLHMMERLLVLRPHITAILKDSNVTKKDDKNLDLDPEQYGLMESLINILKHFDRATTILSAEKTVTISYVLPFALELSSVLETSDSDSVTIANVKSAMLKDLQERFHLKPFDCETIEAMSTLLDPRFHRVSTLGRLLYGEIVDAVKEQLQRLFPEAPQLSSSEQDEHPEPPAKRRPTALELMLPCKLLADKEKKKATSIVSRTVEEEFDVYLQEEEISVNDDPLSWWRAHTSTYPRVSQLARRWLAIPASSTSSERMCSTSGHVAEQRRCNLTPMNVNMLVFLNKNWSLLASDSTASESRTPSAALKTDQESQDASTSVESDDEVLSDDDALPQLPQLF